MNREIKFRAWDKEMKRMIYINNSCDMHDTLVFFDGVAKYHNLQTGDGTDFPLMQYTGIKDKNNNEIYEGDILKTRTRGFATVRTENSNTVVTYKIGAYIWTTLTLSSFLDKYQVVVVGNIYENEEMLKDE